MEEIQTVLTIIDIVNAITKAFDSDGDGEIEVLPQELVDILTTFSDGEQGNNDVENILVEIKDSLMYNEEYTALSEISARMEVIDTRLDKEFDTINYGLGLITTALITLLSWKFFGWLIRLVSV